MVANKMSTGAKTNFTDCLQNYTEGNVEYNEYSLLLEQ